MSYQALARKWRPRDFSELLGQTHVLRPLANALDNDRVHHAFLFTGTRGVGKTTIARILAKSLNCEKGVSAKPCGSCSSCVEIDEGRFIDLIEVDAASRTKVDDTRELLDNVQYKPSHGRFKIYLIDEVHMLSNHSFNALLKTLEEPPPHVKFLFATTDPQKLPVTVLSRCLQFNLQRLSAQAIQSHLAKLLDLEKINYENAALALLARAADGSVRDALSLLDQSIGFGEGQVTNQDVCVMLGTIERDEVYGLLRALSVADGSQLMQVLNKLADSVPDYVRVLDELASCLQLIALTQVLPDALGEDVSDREAIVSLAKDLSAEDVQLYYQICLVGKRDLPLAPDPFSGVQMVLLRMLAFSPLRDDAEPLVKTALKNPKKSNQENRAASSVEQQTLSTGTLAESQKIVQASPDCQALPARPDNWHEIVTHLPVKGMTQQLAVNCTLDTSEEGRLLLILDGQCEHLLIDRSKTQLIQVLQAYWQDSSLRVVFQVGTTQAATGANNQTNKAEQPETPATEVNLHETPAQAQVRALEERQKLAEEAIQQDPNVQALQANFNAKIRDNSVKPLEKEPPSA